MEHQHDTGTLESLLLSPVFHLPVLTDVDTESDLDYIVNEMPADMNREQKQILEWIENYERPVSMHG